MNPDENSEDTTIDTEKQEVPSTVVTPESPTEEPSNEIAPPEVSDTATQFENSTIDTAPEMSSAPESVPPTEKPAPIPGAKKEKKKWYIAAAIVIVLLLVGGGLLYAHSHHKTTPVKAAITKPKATPKPVADITFLQAPKQLANLHFFSDFTTYFNQDCVDQPACTKFTPSVKDADISYYQIGNTEAGNQVLIAEAPSEEGPGGPTDFLAEQTGTNAYAVLSLQSDLGGTEASEFQKTLSSNVRLDTTTIISGLNFPQTMTVNGLQLKSNGDNDSNTRGYFMQGGLVGIRGSYFGKVADGTQPVKVGTVDGKTIYEVTAEDSTNYTAKEWYATVNQVYAADYSPVDPLVSKTDSKDQPLPVNIHWTSGEQNSSDYSNPFVSCGVNGAYLVPKNVTKNQLTTIGTGPNGETIYALPDNSPLLNELYTNDYQSNSSSIQDASLQNLTIQQFQADHAVFVTQNAYNELVVHTRTDLFLEGGCGKPVIYLYPTQTTSVNVKVDASVVKSSPLYPAQTGWLNVTAQPNGTLNYQGKTYPSLYWEGYGLGRYPAIQSGTVVPGNQAAATVRQQLKEQGLKSNEINDFMAFWGPKLPSTPYVRLTWFGTGALQQLAPLTISPKPDTLIRVFLDFQGLDQPISLPVQHLSATPRNGFTVVEWGGLLRDGIQ